MLEAERRAYAVEPERHGDEPVETQCHTGARRQPLLECREQRRIDGRHMPAGAPARLAFGLEAAALLVRVRQLRETVGELDPAGKELEPRRDGRCPRLESRERGLIRGGSANRFRTLRQRQIRSW